MTWLERLNRRIRPAALAPDRDGGIPPAGPAWVDRLIHGEEARTEAADRPVAEMLHLERPPGPWLVGLKDAVAAGWFNRDTGELFPGVTIEADDVVVDVGCGEGNLLGFCADRGARIVGIDNHIDTLAAAERRLSDSGARAQEFHLSHDTGPLPLESGTATVVLCTEVLEHVEDPQQLMAELVRVGAPGARYLISVPSQEGEELTRLQAPASYFEPPNHRRVFSADSFAGLVTGGGLRILRRENVGFFWTVWFALQWHTGVQIADGRHPVLDLWTLTWDTLLQTSGGRETKRILDSHMPKTQIIVAEKPQ